MKDELKGFLVALVGIFLGFIITMGIIMAHNAERKNAEPDLPRVEMIKRGTIEGTYMNYMITVDRETDVEYLIIYRGDNVSVTLMRDSGGMILLRE